MIVQKVLIIGSKGFIGNQLSSFLEKNDFEVWKADVVVEYEYADRYFLIDGTNADFNAIFRKQNFDVCVNCSGAASVPASLENPLRDYQLNTSNVYKLLEAIRLNQPECRFINLSSAAVYGNPVSLPIVEASNLNPISPYGLHKKMSEQICNEFYHFFNIPTCSLRIFSAYGDGLRKQLFWDLYKKSLTGAKVQLFGTGRESRDFIYIGDLIQAIMKVAENGAFNGEAINVANGAEIQIADCVNLFYDEILDYPVSWCFSGEERKGDPVNWVADIERLKDLGYRQQYNLQAGLKQYYKWLKNID